MEENWRKMEGDSKKICEKWLGEDVIFIKFVNKWVATACGACS